MYLQRRSRQKQYSIQDVPRRKHSSNARKRNIQLFHNLSQSFLSVKHNVGLLFEQYWNSEFSLKN